MANKENYQKENQKQGKQLNPYIRFSSIAIQMGLTIYLGSKLGAWLDVKLGNENQLYYKIVSLLAVFFAIYSVIKQVIKITNKNS
ncbi:AtpZ/AtpI family protein [Algibacter pectinivorans]|uniref:Putative F0F1-ATPase subunit Ca2+/Mg2+ transporter n=1 Tax=Algibacter pectinivorans TaxID=870482 RepID=A0A1I1NEF3_9FLAO|nr:AtpZ/AtpI family protein [Algibacter pectinivorans]SFC95632.1 Putative F0F1-ATPase subunit Ca2+/Mg2+ transporter [Algibacter pectinivorans]